MTEITREAILQTVLTAIDTLNETLPEGRKLELSEQTLLYGLGATLDSIALVRLIVEVEQMLFENFDLEISLVNEKALSQRKSPFQRVKTLADYVCSILGSKE